MQGCILAESVPYLTTLVLCGCRIGRTVQTLPTHVEHHYNVVVGRAWQTTLDVARCMCRGVARVSPPMLTMRAVHVRVVHVRAVHALLQLCTACSRKYHAWFDAGQSCHLTSCSDCMLLLMSQVVIIAADVRCFGDDNIPVESAQTHGPARCPPVRSRQAVSQAAAVSQAVAAHLGGWGTQTREDQGQDGAVLRAAEQVCTQNYYQVLACMPEPPREVHMRHSMTPGMTPAWRPRRRRTHRRECSCLLGSTDARACSFACQICTMSV